MKGLFVIFLISISITPSQSSTFEPILNILNTENNERSTLLVKLRSGSLDGLKLITVDRTSNFSYDKAKKGASLLKEKGITIISLKAPSITRAGGGKVYLTYLKQFSILGSTYDTIPLMISKNNKRWQLFFSGSAVEKLSLTPHPFGISHYDFR